jgi:hypothetical protein
MEGWTTEMADFLAQARGFIFFALIGGALTLSGMLGAGGAAVIARFRVLDEDRMGVAGAVLILWLVSSSAVLVAGKFLKPEILWALAAGCTLALMRLLLALKFDLRAARPRGADFDQLLRAGFRPLVASAMFLPAALLGNTLPGAILYAALLLLANVALERSEPEKKRAAGTLTALAILMAIPLMFLPGRVNALGGLLIAWLTAVSLTAGLGSIAHLPSAFYEAWLPVRAWFIRRRAGR